MGDPVPYGVVMRGMLSRLVVLALIGAGCTTTGTPATVPSSLPATTTTAAVTTTTLPPTTTTTAATTTTGDRVAEIEAIFQDLEERRLQALYEGDEEAFKALFANNEYMERSLALFDLVKFVDRPLPNRVEVLQLMHEGAECLAAEVETRYEGVLVEGVTAAKIVVVESVDDGWGISYVGEGWACDGPHPLSP
jgi:hypothetical protein